MEAGLMKLVQSLNRSWTYDSYFSLHRPIHRKGKVRGKCSGTIIDMGWGSQLVRVCALQSVLQRFIPSLRLLLCRDLEQVVQFQLHHALMFGYYTASLSLS